jgi:hypothetical protein
MSAAKSGRSSLQRDAGPGLHLRPKSLGTAETSDGCCQSGSVQQRSASLQMLGSRPPLPVRNIEWVAFEDIRRRDGNWSGALCDRIVIAELRKNPNSPLCYS